MAIQFYCVKTRSHVELDESKCTKSKKPLAGGRCTYIVKGVDAQGNKLNKFVNKAAWDALKCKEA